MRKKNKRLDYFDEIVIGGGTAAALWLMMSVNKSHKKSLLIAPKHGEPWLRRGDKPMAQPRHLISPASYLSAVVPPEDFLNNPDKFITGTEYSLELNRIIKKSGINTLTGSIGCEGIVRCSNLFAVCVQERVVYGKRVIVAAGPGARKSLSYCYDGSVNDPETKILDTVSFLENSKYEGKSEIQTVLVYGGGQSSGWCAQRVINNGDRLIWFCRRKPRHTTPYAPGARGDKVRGIARKYLQYAEIIDKTLKIVDGKVRARFIDKKSLREFSVVVDKFICAIGFDYYGVDKNGSASPLMMLSRSIRQELRRITDTNREVSDENITLAVGTKARDLLLIGSSAANHPFHSNYRDAAKTLPAALSPRFGIGLSRVTIAALKQFIDIPPHGVVNLNTANRNSLAVYVSLCTQLKAGEINQWVNFIVTERAKKPNGFTRYELFSFFKSLSDKTALADLCGLASLRNRVRIGINYQLRASSERCEEDKQVRLNMQLATTLGFFRLRPKQVFTPNSSQLLRSYVL